MPGVFTGELGHYPTAGAFATLASDDFATLFHLLSLKFTTR
jgi:hypothetical protein